MSVMVLTLRRRTLALISVLAFLTWLVMTSDQIGASSGGPQDRVVFDAPEGPITHGELENGRSDLFTTDIGRRLGGRLAGVWITDDIIYNVGIVAPTDADRALVTERAHAYGATGVVVEMKYPPAYLGRLFDAIDEVMIGTDVICSADVDEPTNKIKVVLRQPDERVIAEIRRIVPSGILVLLIDEPDCDLEFLVGEASSGES